jgi:hypothetical protein
MENKSEKKDRYCRCFCPLLAREDVGRGQCLTPEEKENGKVECAQFILTSVHVEITLTQKAMGGGWPVQHILYSKALSLVTNDT